MAHRLCFDTPFSDGLVTYQSSRNHSVTLVESVLTMTSKIRSIEITDGYVVMVKDRFSNEPCVGNGSWFSTFKEAKQFAIDGGYIVIWG